jgi:hypothetical protein
MGCATLAMFVNQWNYVSCHKKDIEVNCCFENQNATDCISYLLVVQILRIEAGHHESQSRTNPSGCTGDGM